MRSGMRGVGGGGGGEIVQVQGGHIVRSTGRKDRHSKVYTAKGPRDRRVRLSAHTAIQFYDVQDRLGYDRPSKAVDWLIRNAKAAIDKLAELPPWHPEGTNAPAGVDDSTNNGYVPVMEVRTTAGSEEMKDLETSGFLPQQLDSVPGSMIPRNGLGLSLQSFQVPKQQERTALFPSSTGPLGFGFEAGDNYLRPTPNWISNGSCAENRSDFSFSQQQQPTTIGLSGYKFPQRGTLQSSFSTAFQQSFSFAGRFEPDGFPSLIHDEEGPNGFGSQRPPSS